MFMKFLNHRFVQSFWWCRIYHEGQNLSKFSIISTNLIETVYASGSWLFLSPSDNKVNLSGSGVVAQSFILRISISVGLGSLHAMITLINATSESSAK